ncbi:enoyl-CoA hydratase-related protein [Actinomycetospora corticicola]|uniref:2-(1,2-epoxy-1,2-dihydrophenyl)acetyl-CoA isomerase n=1 Tax=Actinomycetospora corticicola TaxID=663602 RepID=A0A7Y9E2I7_9PSEU|nr:2-(1,2-epoxy-1,2-dihydrophenyl)acetyl-CoA isomerase [Actinomycetospora corticicola]
MPAETGTDDDAVTVDRTTPAVAVVRLERPDSRNALTGEVKTALRDALTEVGADESIRAVVLTGTGKAFCAGQDLREHAAALRHDAATAFDTVTEHYNPIARALTEMPKPVVAAINGTCVGAGLGFALACDLRLAAEGTSFSTAFSAIGLGGDSGLSASLAHCVGASRATALLLLGDAFTADQARDWGILHRIVPRDALDHEAVTLAARLAAGPTRAYAEIKRAVALGATSSLPDVLAHEAEAQARLGLTDDHRNAVEAFLAKQQPAFTGR